MSYFLTYLVFMLDSINSLLILLGAVSGIIGIIAGILTMGLWLSDDFKDDKVLLGRFLFGLKATLIPSLLCLSVAAFIPSTKTAIAIYAIPTIVNSGQTQAITQKSLMLINKVLDDKLDDLKDVKDALAENVPDIKWHKKS